MILGMDELSETDKLTVSRARKISASCRSVLRRRSVHRLAGSTSSLKDTMWPAIVAGEYDHLPEQAFTWSARSTKRSKRRRSCSKAKRR